MELDDVLRLAVLRRTNLTANPDPAFDRFARMVQRQLKVPVALVSLVDDVRQFFPGMVGLPLPWADDRETPLSHSFCQHVVTAGEPLVISDARLDPRVKDSLAISELGVVGYAGMPLTGANGVVLGSLCAITTEAREWLPDELEFLSDLAAACSSELRLRATAAAARAATARVALLSEVSQAVVTTLDASEAIGRLVRVVVPTMGDWATAGLVDDETRVRISSSRHRDADLAPAVERFAALQADALDDESVTGSAVRTGEALVVNGSEVRRRALAVDPDYVDELEVASMLVVPLRARGGALGYLTLGRGKDRAPFGEAEVYDALDIGRRTGLALDNAELFRQQQTANETMQRSMLTRLPEPDHLHVVARYVPAAEMAQVGGDWYDAFVQPDGGTVLAVGDVMGHDIAAAAMMGQLRNIVRAIAYDSDESPAKVLSRVDRSLRGLRVNTLATVILARIEQTAESRARGVRTLRWSNAGHPPPVLLGADGKVRLLDSESDVLLGIMPDSPREDHTVELAPGDVVLLYTDGLVERRDSPLETGLLRLQQALAGATDVALDQLLDDLLTKMLPQRSEDDVALVAVRAMPEDEPRPTEAGPSHL